MDIIILSIRYMHIMHIFLYGIRIIRIFIKIEGVRISHRYHAMCISIPKLMSRYF